MAYPPTSEAVRARLEALASLPPDAPEWVSFMREVMRIPLWMLPAVHAAVQQRAWTTVSDPLESIRSRVRRLAIDMKLNNSEQRIAIDPDIDSDNPR